MESKMKRPDVLSAASTLRHSVAIPVLADQGPRAVTVIDESLSRFTIPKTVFS